MRKVFALIFLMFAIIPMFIAALLDSETTVIWIDEFHASLFNMR